MEYLINVGFSIIFLDLLSVTNVNIGK